MNGNYKKIILILMILFFSETGFSQKYNFKNIGTKQGLSNLEITDIIQDDEGFIWITTLNGVAKYDGRTFEFFKKNKGLSGNFTRHLFIDSKSRLWCSTYGQGINYIYHDSLYAFDPDSLFKWRGAGHFTEDNKGNVWIAGLNDIVLFKDNQFFNYDSIHQITNIIDIVYRADTLWLATINKGVYAYDIKSKTYKNFNTNDGLKNNICYDIFIDAKGYMWAGCYGGISLIKSDTILSFDISIDFNKNRVKKIIEDKEGYLWLALYGNGIAKWDKNKKKTVKVFNEKNGLNHPYVNTLFFDRFNNLWIGTDGNGVYVLNDFSIETFDIDYGLSSNKINDFNIKKDHIQILTFDKGEILMYKDTIINNIITIDNDEIAALNTSVELNDTIWYGTSSGIRYRLNTKNSFYSIKNVSPFSDNVLGSIIYKNRPYFAGIGSYLTVVKDSLIIYASEFKNGASPIDFCVDKNNNLWSCDFSAISFLNPINNKLTVFEKTKKNRHFYTDCFSYKGVMYFVGEDNFETIELIDKDTIFKQHETFRNMGIDAAQSIFIFNNILYVSSPNGLYLMNLKDIDKANFSNELLTTEEGLPNEFVNQLKIDENGVIWMASYSGLVKYNPSLKWQANNPPKVYLKQIELFSEPIHSSKLHQLTYLQNHLTFKWSTIAFNNINQIQFTYKLEGYDEDWSKPTTELSTVYKKLPPGNYQFKIKSRYQSGEWSDPMILSGFYIDSPFWKKWWFILIVILLLLGILANLIYSVIITKKQKVTLQQFSKELINSQEQERSKISKDLHDSVGQLLLFVRNKLRSEKADDEIVNELDSALDEVRQISRQLHPYQLEKFGLSKAIELLVEKASQNSNIFFSEEIDQVNNFLPKNYELIIYRIIQETINNIIKHSQAKSAKIEIEKQEKQIKLVIKDNGKGFNAKEILSGKKHAFGLTGIIERVKMINGGLTIESSEKGTTIKIYIPL